MMKKMVCLLLAAVFLIVLCSCGTQMTAVENYLIALKKMDFEGVMNTVSESNQNLENLYKNLNDEEKETLQKLYGLVQYTIKEETKENGVRLVDITLKIPDVKRIFELTDKQILVSAETASKVVSDMIDSGTVSKTLILEKSFTVQMIESDGKWRIDSGDANKEFFDTIGFEKTMHFFVYD